MEPVVATLQEKWTHSRDRGGAGSQAPFLREGSCKRYAAVKSIHDMRLHREFLIVAERLFDFFVKAFHQEQARGGGYRESFG